MNETTETYNFIKLGHAIKNARKARGITREDLAETLDIASRHLQAIENEGQCPSFSLFIRMVTMFNISTDQYIFPDKPIVKSTLRRQVDVLLDTFDDKDLSIISGTATAICNAKDTEE
jgi:Predicted transcriptional regulators